MKTVYLAENFNEAVELIRSNRPDIAEQESFRSISENKDVKALMVDLKNKQEPGYIALNPVYDNCLDTFSIDASASRVRMFFLPKLFGQNVLVYTGRPIPYKLISMNRILAQLNRNNFLDIGHEEFSFVLSYAGVVPVNTKEGEYNIYSAAKNVVCYSDRLAFPAMYQKPRGKTILWSVKAEAILASPLGHLYIGEQDLDDLINMDFRRIGLGRLKNGLVEKDLMAISQKMFARGER